MPNERFVSLSILASTACAACVATPRQEMAPLVLGVPQTVEYHAEVRPAPYRLGALQAEAPPAEPSAEAISVRARLLALDEDEARGLGLLQVGGWNIARSEAEAWLGTPGWTERVSPSSLELVPGQAGTLSVVNERAYVSSFEVTAAPQALLADPVVDVLQEGSRLVVRALPAGDGGVALELTLELADLQALQEVEVRIPGGLTPVTLQQPVVSRQRLTTSVALGPDDGLLLIALAPEGSGRLVTFVDATRHER